MLQSLSRYDEPMDQLLEVMRRLRAPDGCPWDREQTHQSLRPYLLEEAAEAVDAVDSGDPLELAGELGDVLLQVAFHSVIAEEHGDFTYQTVENAIVNKLVRRHPHVFGDVSVADSNEVVTNWQAIKAQERAGKPEKHPAERVPKALGALARATEVASALGMPKGSRQDVLHALETATDDAESVSNVLEAVMAWARGAGVHAEVVLRERTDRRVRETVQTVVARTETV
jgi:XTP/dITP diphosphohydrolase